MFAGPGHFTKQDRLIKKWVRDPNLDINPQQKYSVGIRNFLNNTVIPANSISDQKHLESTESYRRRQMFFYAFTEENGI